MYKTELQASALEDNPSHPSSTLVKRELLRTYQDAWSRLPQLRPHRDNATSIDIEQGPAWELAGGVLGQTSGSHKIHFRQLGSDLRGVPREAWDVNLSLNCRDFTMDPGQDLLVTICAPLGESSTYACLCRQMLR